MTFVFFLKKENSSHNHLNWGLCWKGFIDNL